MEFPQIGFKHWMNQGEIAKFAKAMRSYWQRVADVMALALNKHDTMTCPLPILHLIAWERNVTPLDRESEELFRVRVTRAYRFTRLAGETAGFKQILSEVGFQSDVDERFDAVDWDIVDIKGTDEDMSTKNWLLSAMIKKYRRTCRRYRIKVEFETLLHVHTGNFVHRFDQHIASSNITIYPKLHIRAGTFEHKFSSYIARIDTF